MPVQETHQLRITTHEKARSHRARSCLTANPRPPLGVAATTTTTAAMAAPANPMRLWAIADIHLSFKGNREEWGKLKARREEYAPGQKRLTDGLILAGDGMWFFFPSHLFCSISPEDVD